MYPRVFELSSMQKHQAGWCVAIDEYTEDSVMAGFSIQMVKQLSPNWGFLKAKLIIFSTELRDAFWLSNIV